MIFQEYCLYLLWYFFFRFRVKDYIAGGLSSKIKDPDGGIHLAKAKASLGLMEEINAKKLKENFPVDGFTEDLNILPAISFGTIWRYMIEESDAKKQLSTAKPLVKGYNFFKSGHVLSIKCRESDGKFYIKSQVLPSMKKTVLYNCYIVLNKCGKVMTAYDGCPAGIDGRCNHVTSTLFALEEFFKQSKAPVNPSLTPAISCTSKPCVWNVPRKRKVDNLPISQAKFRKHQHGKPHKSEDNALPSTRDVRAPHQQNPSLNTDASNLLHHVKEIEKKTGKKMALSLILPQKTLEENKERISVEHNYCTPLTPIEPVETEGNISTVSTELLSPVKCHPVSLEEIKERCIKLKKRLFVDEKDVDRIEKETVGQSANENWNLHRKIRITASKCHRIATLQATTSPTKAIEEVLHYKQIPQTRAMKEGLSREGAVIAEYIKSKKLDNQNVIVQPCGLFISKSHNYLAASPDGLVYNADSTELNSSGLVEIKIVFLKENETLYQALVRKRIFLPGSTDGHLVINQKHKYHYQVQQQMFVAQKSWVDLVVKGVKDLPDRSIVDTDGVFISTVNFNREFWTSVLPKLEAFYNEHILVELAYPRVKFGLSRLDLRGC